MYMYNYSYSIKCDTTRTWLETLHISSSCHWIGILCRIIVFPVSQLTGSASELLNCYFDNDLHRFVSEKPKSNLEAAAEVDWLYTKIGSTVHLN